MSTKAAQSANTIGRVIRFRNVYAAVYAMNIDLSEKNTRVRIINFRPEVQFLSVTVDNILHVGTIYWRL